MIITLRDLKDVNDFGFHILRSVDGMKKVNKDTNIYYFRSKTLVITSMILVLRFQLNRLTKQLILPDYKKHR